MLKKLHIFIYILILILIWFFSIIQIGNFNGENLYSFSYYNNTLSSEYFSIWDNLLRLFTSIYLHGSFKHLLFNIIALFVFGSIIIKFIDSMLEYNKLPYFFSVIIFFLFFNLSGALATLIYILFANEEKFILLGASGAISALLGATMRLYPKAGGGYYIFPLKHSRVIFASVVYVLFSVVVGISSLDKNIFSDSYKIAWIVHINGYIIGLLTMSFATKWQAN